jgi:hypothetical protein
MAKGHVLFRVPVWVKSQILQTISAEICKSGRGGGGLAHRSEYDNGKILFLKKSYNLQNKPQAKDDHALFSAVLLQ